MTSTVVFQHTPSSIADISRFTNASWVVAFRVRIVALTVRRTESKRFKRSSLDTKSLHEILASKFAMCLRTATLEVLVDFTIQRAVNITTNLLGMLVQKEIIEIDCAANSPYSCRNTVVCTLAWLLPQPTEETG